MLVLDNNTPARQVNRKKAPTMLPDTAVTTTAVLVDESSISVDIGNATLEDVFKSKVIEGDIRINLVAKDPRTGEPVTLSGVRVQIPEGSNLEGFRKGQQFVLHCSSYKEFLSRNVGAMIAVPSPKKPPVQNQSIPTPIKKPDPMVGFGNSGSPVCAKYKAAEKEAKSYMGFVADRSDLTVMQGPSNGRSPGIAIQQSDGKLYIFDGTGEQYIGVSNNGITMKANIVRFGGADIGRSTPMFPVPMMENKVLDIVPNGTILSPQPKLLINILEAVNLITSVMDLVRVGVLCKRAASLILSGYSGPKLEETVKAARYSATEVAYYGGTKKVPPKVDYIVPDTSEERLVVQEEGGDEDATARAEEEARIREAMSPEIAALNKRIKELEEENKSKKTSFFRF